MRLDRADHRRSSHRTGKAFQEHGEDGQHDAGQHRDPFERHHGQVSHGEKEGLRTNPEIKNRQLREPKPVDLTSPTHKGEKEKTEQKLEQQSVPNSVFGSDRVTISPEAQVVPAITRKSEAVGVKRGRQKYLPPGLNRLAAGANPPASSGARFEEFLSAFVQNFS